MRVQTNRVATEMQNYQSTDGHITRKKKHRALIIAELFCFDEFSEWPRSIFTFWLEKEKRAMNIMMRCLGRKKKVTT